MSRLRDEIEALEQAEADLAAVPDPARARYADRRAVRSQLKSRGRPTLQAGVVVASTPFWVEVKWKRGTFEVLRPAALYRV